MKRTFYSFAIISCFMLLCSCTHTLYTHQQILQGQHTRDDVLKQFGKPDQIYAAPGFEQWVYNMDRPSSQKILITDTVKTQANVSSPDTSRVAKPVEYTRYVKFMFDDQGKVIGYKAEEVDLTKNKKDSFGKSLLTITGGIVVVSVLVAIELYKDGAFDN